nr:MAG TPA: tail protein [Caudoviricetes sp.]
MITFYDEKGNGYGAQVELKTKNAVNGERSISGTIVSNKQVLSKLDRGWSFTFDGELYKIIYAKPKDEGKNISLSFDAVHQFFYDFEHSNCYKEFNGSNRFEVYIEAIFKDSGYRYVIEAQAGSIRKENFGNASRLKMFKDIIKAAGLEFSVTGKVVRILKKVGTDLSTVVRKNFNMNELTIEKNIGNFITYKKGLGAWKDENNHDAGRYTSEYESPLARIYGRIEGEPVTDERYKETGKLLERLKKEVDESYSISVQLDMEDLTQAGYKYTRPRAGDYIMAINETIGFREKIRIVSYESSYDVTGRLLSHKVTCNDIGTVQKAITSEGSIMRSVSESKEYAEGALEVATRALVSANGKNTNYYGATKPKDEPRGTLHEGDLLYLTVGEETELYYWSGSEWLPKILKVDTSKIEKIVNDAQTSTTQAIAQANAKAEEALKKAGTLPDTSKLSDQIKQQILSSPDLQNKVTEGINSVDGDTIYSKIVSKVSRNFATKGKFDALDRVQNDMGRDLIGLSRKIATQTLEFNKLTESNKLYERILGTSETGAPDQLSRLVMSSDIFQTEVGKYVTDDNNLIVNSATMDKNTLVGATNSNVRVTLNNGTFTIYAFGLTSYNWTGFSLPIYVKKIYHGETYTLGFKYRIRYYPDSSFAFNIKNHGLNKTLLSSDIGKERPPLHGWQEFQKTFKVEEDFAFGEDANYPFYIYLAKNGWIEFKEPILVRGSNTGPYKPSQFDDAYKSVEATRTQVSQLAGSWSVKNLSSAGDVLNSINLLANGTNRIDGRLTHITGETVIDNAVIKDGMIANLNADKITGGTIDASKINVINVNASNVLAGTLTGMTMRGGRIEALNGKMNIDLQNGQMNILDNGAGLTRQGTNLPTQILRMVDDTQITNTGKKYSTLTVLGSTRDKNALTHVSGFAGMRVYNRDETLTELVGDQIILYTNNNQRSPWIFKAGNDRDHHRLIPSNDNGQKHSIGRSDKPLHELHVNEIYLNGVRLQMALKDMLNRMGYVGTGRWGDRIN